MSEYPSRQDNAIRNREYCHVLTFLEEAQQHGLDYAEQRLLQRLDMGLCEATELGIAVGGIAQRIEQKYCFYHWWYVAVIGLAIIAIPLYLYVLTVSSFPIRLRQSFCSIIAALIIFIRLYTGFLQELIEKHRLYRSEMAALSRIIGGDQSH
ncbi:hypothetical protein KI811_18195 [Geobacter hydrogenophilus]|uniref:Uncharacterized protein n=1 Tax=Geobacter hydrogenophilus TaxID=40983 RepID=A0A9W6G343_9BACT|nr:hypothetical protein [Geobacter hydrogenophilus]MBT0895740.1 hypothetical protein [Geobacter hydrogenophilus]GLI39482.1 hypothetical protein GHYDROH2_29830 [Geobacter hydrogenophilus]